MPAGGRRAVVALAASWLCLGTARAQDLDRKPPFVTTPLEVVDRMLRLAQTGPQDIVIDLGSGDGRIVIAAARDFGAQALGVELDSALVELARERARATGVAARAAFEHGDALHADVSRATVVTTYLLPGLMERLRPKLLAELPPGARIVSHAFVMSGWRPDRSETVRVLSPHPGQGETSNLHLWIVPAQARGQWRSSGSSRAGGWRIRIEQNHQEITLEGSADGAPLEFDQATLTGREIAWRVRGARFRGRVEGERIVGELASAERTLPLVLEREP